MISKKVFNADGSNKRFLSDFIIQSEQFVRVYTYIYDPTLASDGSEDVLQDGSTTQADWSYPNNLWIRGVDIPVDTKDILTLEKWDLVTNSILLYDAPLSPSKIWIEVATTPEEFGETLTQPAVEIAEAARDIAVASASSAQLSEWVAEAEAMTSDSYATEPLDTYVKEYTSNGNGTFTTTLTDKFSSLHYSLKASNAVTKAQRDEYHFVSLDGDTTFDVTYNIGFIDVYIEGIKLVPNIDFNATNGTTVVLTSPIGAGLDVQITAWGIFVAVTQTVEWE